MFAVKGWSVSADKLKSETAASAPKPAPANTAQEDGAAKQDEKAATKKRKRPQGAEVTSSNLADLWEQVIEGKPAGGKKKPRTQQGAKQESQHSNDKSNKKDAPASTSQPAAQEPAATEGKKAKKQKTKDQFKNAEPRVTLASEEKNDEAPTPDVEGGKKNKKNKKLKKDANHGDAEDEQKPSVATEPETKTVVAPKPAAPAPKLTPMQAAMREKLISARFRHLNETLYTRPSAEAFSLFADSPEMFTEYHEGFRRQVDVWPENPVDGYIADIKKRAVIKGAKKDRHEKPGSNRPAPSFGNEPLPRTNGTCTIADLGCGDAKLGGTLGRDKKKLKLDLLNYDLQSPSPHVTRADIANLPLADGSVNVAIFCLALMGTNWLDFIEEAYRILHWKGELWVAEIKSRLGQAGSNKKAPGGVVTHSVGNRKKQAATTFGKKDKAAANEAADKLNNAALAIEVDGAEDRSKETDVTAFVEALRKRGFVLQGEADLSNKMFVKMHFIKAAPAVVGKNAFPPAGGEDGGRGGDRATGSFGRDNNRRNSKFGDRRGGPSNKGGADNEEAAKVNETSILKPCVYKIR